MPTYKHAAYIPRSIASLQSQTLRDWELIIVDDGSPDDTPRTLLPYRTDARVRYQRLDVNRGLGAALNFATSLARGLYIAYLPSDDAYYPEHLESLVITLEKVSRAYLAYGGVRWGFGSQYYGATLFGDEAVGRETEALKTPSAFKSLDPRLGNGNMLALVQVLHRRGLEGAVRWPTRDEIVSDTLEREFWSALSRLDSDFAYAGAVTCEWVDHPDQRHKIIANIEDPLPFGALPASGRGLAGYRNFYWVPSGQWINWRPAQGPHVDERGIYGALGVQRGLEGPDSLRILLVGELGWNPERLVSFEQEGHRLYGLWIRSPAVWDTVGPLPYGHIENIPLDAHWPDRVKAIQPHIIYGLLNWEALSLLSDVLDAALGIPFVFHFKEGPIRCREYGLWSVLMKVLRGSDGHIFINDETFEWFQMMTNNMLSRAATYILDGELVKADWMTDDWSAKLSTATGEIHTVCSGRPLGLPFRELADAHIHVHFYGEQFHRWYPNVVSAATENAYLHLHDTVYGPNWVSELSVYDAGWLHVFDGKNAGDLSRATWDDLNIPARIGTYATAGLPWIMKDNGHSRVATQSIAKRFDVGIFFNTVAELAAKLNDSDNVSALTRNMRQSRHHFTFDHHVKGLITFFKSVICSHRPSIDQSMTR